MSFDHYAKTILSVCDSSAGKHGGWFGRVRYNVRSGDQRVFFLFAPVLSKRVYIRTLHLISAQLV